MEGRAQGIDRTKHEVHKATSQINDRHDGVLRQGKYRLDAVEEGSEDGADDVEDGGDEGGD